MYSPSICLQMMPRKNICCTHIFPARIPHQDVVIHFFICPACFLYRPPLQVFSTSRLQYQQWQFVQLFCRIFNFSVPKCSNIPAGFRPICRWNLRAFTSIFWFIRIIVFPRFRLLQILSCKLTPKTPASESELIAGDLHLNAKMLLVMKYKVITMCQF